MNDIVKEKVLIDFGLSLADASAFEQALFVLKEMRNQCAHLELITRFKLKSQRAALNNFNDIRAMSGLARGNLSYLDVLKILNTFVPISDIKKQVLFFIWEWGLREERKSQIKHYQRWGERSCLYG